ncbi:MAG: DUF4230 domain-containing protein [Oscillospiraceae bacterium]|nr:DUF4230 domain-containing protein [Oscillospiraceae bacterium]
MNKEIILEETDRMPKKKSPALIICAIIIMIVSLIVCGYFYWSIENQVLPDLSEAAGNQFRDAKTAMSEEVYNGFYRASFDLAEERHHTKNSVSINIGSINEEANLEVLEVSDVEFIVMGEEDNDNNITAWLEVPGKGIFTVNMEIGEFLIDNERHNVTVRIPNPELTNFSVDYKNVKKILFKNDIFNDSISVGEDIARNEINEGYNKIKDKLKSDPDFYKSAEDSATAIITNLVLALNPDIPDLNVTIEFFD